MQIYVRQLQCLYKGEICHARALCDTDAIFSEIDYLILATCSCLVLVTDR